MIYKNFEKTTRFYEMGVKISKMCYVLAAWRSKSYILEASIPHMSSSVVYELSEAIQNHSPIFISGYINTWLTISYVIL